MKMRYFHLLAWIVQMILKVCPKHLVFHKTHSFHSQDKVGRLIITFTADKKRSNLGDLSGRTNEHLCTQAKNSLFL